MSNIKLAVLASAVGLVLSLGVAARADADQAKAQKQVDNIREADPPKAQPSPKSAQQISNEQNKIPAAQVPQSFKTTSPEPPSPIEKPNKLNPTNDPDVARGLKGARKE